MNFILKLLLVIISSMAVPSLVQAQLIVNDNVTPNDLASALAGVGVSVSNVTLNCNKGAYGTFDATASNVGIDGGVLLTTGMAKTQHNKCRFYLNLDDSNFDQWDCGQINVYINGNACASHTISASHFGFLNTSILVENGDLLELEYVTSGGTNCDENEHSFTLSDANFNQLAQATGPLTPGIIYSGTVNCTPPANPVAYGADGPNNGNSADWQWNTIVNDPDLMSIETSAVNDACILEFDILPTCDTMEIDFVFASDEYPTFVASFFDVFGFFLNGPNPSGGNYVSENIAYIPGTNTPITIGTINNGTTNTGPCQNCAYYVNNGNGEDCSANPSPFCTDTTITRYNGFTIPMKARAAVTPCESYHMKIAIADKDDWALDTGVFLRAKGLSCPNGGSINPINHQDTIVEGCLDGSIDFIRLGDSTNVFNVDLEYIGTATAGTDYVQPPITLTFAPFDTIESIDISLITDNAIEGIETIQVVASYEMCLGTIVRDTIDIAIFDELLLTPTSNPEDCGVCNGDASVSVSPSFPPINYTWDAATGNQTTATATNLCYGTFGIAVSDANGCTADTIIAVDRIGPPITLAITDESCLGLNNGSIVLSTTGTGTYSYELNGVSQSSGTFSNLTPNTYTVSIVDVVQGCRTDSIVTIVAGSCCLSATLDATATSCFGQCDGSTGVTNVQNEIGTIAYEWIDNTGNPIGQTTGNATNLCGGDFSVIISDDVCSITENITVSEPTALNITLTTDTTICIGGSVNLTATADNGIAPYTYNWSNGITTAINTVSPVINTNYTVVATDANGCTTPTGTVDVSLHSALSITVTGDKVICEGDSVGLGVTAVGGLGAPYNCNWTNDAGSGWTSTLQTPKVRPTNTTRYFVEVTDGCETPSKIDSVLVSVEANPVVQFSADTLENCVPLNTTFTNLTQMNPGSTVVWDFGDGNTSNNSGPISHSYATSGCYDVHLTVTSANGCTSSNLQADYVCAYDYPSPGFTMDPQPTNLQNTTIHFTNSSLGANRYNWSLEAVGNSTDTDPVITFPSDTAGTYTVCLTAISAFGCELTVCDSVVINSTLTVYVPNAFTPNGDGLNDFFQAIVEGYDASDFNLSLFNRWGAKIFETNSPLNYWDGRVNGRLVEDGVYVWKIVTSEQNTGIPYTKTGQVIVFR